MIKPTNNQPTNRNHVATDNPSIRPKQVTIAIIGVIGENGTRKDRGRSGCVRRKMITPTDTMTKANKVPMFARAANVSMSQSPAGMPTAKPAIHVLTCGV